MKRILLALFAIAIVATTGFALYLRSNACPAEQYRDAIRATMFRWQDTDELARQSSKLSLPVVILELQSIRRDFEQIEPPRCAEDIHQDILVGMSSAIAGFQSFMEGQPDFVIEDQFDLSNIWMKSAADALSNLK